MKLRRFVAGFVLAGAVLGALAPAADAKVVPTVEDIQRNIQDLKPVPPGFAVPTVDPQNPQLPVLPFVQVPAGLNPALYVLGPLGVTTCQAAYLGPLGGAVALTVVLDALPPDTLPIQPSFLAPALSPVTTACVLAPFPRWTACKNDKAIQEQSEAVPAPFASLVVELDAIQKIVSFYALNRTPLKGDPAAVLATRLGCK
ncbi:MAG: hypothetical protein Q8K63_15565 [Acidimicrobiales bacterium]|nr:hypothetical protein [Acidimicrobiales bacterium]